MPPATATAPAPESLAAAPPGPPRRLRGVDVARGLAVVGMLLVDNRGSDAISRQLVHVPWNGLHVADVVFPVFLLVVGVSLPFSSRAQRPRAVLWRTAKLLALGWLIVTAKYGWGSAGSGVLGHIAGAYLLCWLILRLPRRAQVPVAGALAVAVAVLYVLVPVPGVGARSLSAGSTWADWFDSLLGLGSGAEGPHAWIPGALTVFLGVLAGRTLLRRPGAAAVRPLLAGGAGLLAAGAALIPVLPLNKHLWTPSYVLFTGGIGLLLLALTHWLVDVRGIARPFLALETLGRNAIVAFAVSELVFRAVGGRVWQAWVVQGVAQRWGDVVAAYLYPALSVAVIWGVCSLLRRRGIVVRI